MIGLKQALYLLAVVCLLFQPACDNEHEEDLLVIPKDVSVSDLDRLVPRNSVPPEFGEAKSESAPIPQSSLFDTEVPSLAVSFSDSAGNRIAVVIAVEGAAANIKRYKDLYGKGPNGELETAKDSPNVGQGSASFLSKTGNRSNRIDIFVDRGVFAMVQTYATDLEAFDSAREDFIRELDRNIQNFVAERGVQD